MKNVFYQIGDSTTYRTADAWQSIVTGAPHWRLSLFEDTFSKLPWAVEPTDSFESLIKKRIDSIRSKYKKIRLWYSSGRDSHCILREFVKHSAVIDELVFVDWAYLDSVRGDDEIVQDAIKRTYAANQNLSIPKVTFFRPNGRDYFRYWKLVSANQHSGGVGSNFGFNVNSFSAILDCFTEFQDEDTCNLFGLEKPKLKVKNNQVMFQMVDCSIQHAMSPLHNIEWFFLNDTVPELVVKQCHMLLKHAKVLARNSFNNDLSFAIRILQTNQRYYNDYCLALGLGSAVSPVTGSGMFKHFGLRHAAHKNLHNTAQSDVWDADRLYNKFFLNITDISNKYAGSSTNKRLVGILSKEYTISNVL